MLLLFLVSKPSLENDVQQSKIVNMKHQKKKKIKTIQYPLIFV